MNRLKGEPYLELYIPEPNSGCWLWIGKFDRYGYGRVSLNSTGESLAHRLFWKTHRGPIPEGLEIMHKCDTPACVNPDHLKPGTHRENMRDASKKKRLFVGRRLSDEQVRLIRRSSVSVKKLGPLLGVSHATVHRARTRESYTDVLDEEGQPT